MIRFVYFDVGETLVTPRGSVGEVYAAAGRPHGLTADPAAIDRVFRDLWARRAQDGRAQQITTLGADDEATRRWWRELVDEILGEVGFAGDADGCFEACYAAFATAEAWSVFEDVTPTLRHLRSSGLSLGVLSNWDHRLEALMGTLDLSRYFRCFVVSALVGRRKPDPALFQEACRVSGHPPEEIAHVGNDPLLDAAPARAAGMRAFLIDRRGEHQDAGRLDGLQQLPGQLGVSPLC